MIFKKHIFKSLYIFCCSLPFLFSVFPFYSLKIYDVDGYSLDRFLFTTRHFNLFESIYNDIFGFNMVPVFILLVIILNAVLFMLYVYKRKSISVYWLITALIISIIFLSYSNSLFCRAKSLLPADYYSRSMLEKYPNFPTGETTKNFYWLDESFGLFSVIISYSVGLLLLLFENFFFKEFFKENINSLSSEKTINT